MKQILQSLKTGAVEVAAVPCPSPGRHQVLIRSLYTLVSAGTERMLLQFGRAGWVDKARQQPDKARMVLDKIRTDGLMPTLESVFNKLDQPLPLGYCNVGVVMQVGADAPGFSPGERVVSTGKHAEAVCVPVNLCAKVPPGVASDEAAFTVLGAIALQGIRLLAPALGETVVVSGLGLVGLIAVQLLRAHGCRVLGSDFDPARLALARRFGAEIIDLSAGADPVAAAHLFSRGRGVDAVLITASTSGDELIHQSALMCRKRGRIVLTGTTGLKLSRADFYEKELTFQVSCSYGPGRYDSDYEERGQDYPVGFVRWTAQRNFEAVLDMMASGRLDVQPLTSHRYAVDDAQQAYALLGGAAPSLGILLEYPTAVEKPDAELRLPTVKLAGSPLRAGTASLGFIGAGNYATAVLIPAFKRAGGRLRTIASSGGVSATHAGRKFGFEQITTDSAGPIVDSDIDAVVIATRHDSHARYVLAALASGKHVFVEKPLCLSMPELIEIETAACSAKCMVMVGFNRRFAPHVLKMRSLLAGATGPKCMVMTVNAGAVPFQHWTHDPQAGGGRIIGEACHFIDLLRHLAGVPIVRWQRMDMMATAGDCATLQLAFADGSIGTVHYYANGSKSFPKERLEIFAAGRVLQLDNFRTLKAYGWPGFGGMKLWRQDKGQSACAAQFLNAVVNGRDAPIPLEEIIEVSRVTIELGQAAG